MSVLSKLRSMLKSLIIKRNEAVYIINNSESKEEISNAYHQKELADQEIADIEVKIENITLEEMAKEIEIRIKAAETLEDIKSEEREEKDRDMDR